MSKLISNIFKVAIPIGVITRLHFFDTATNTIQWNLIGMFGSGLFLYLTVARKIVKAQKEREWEEYKNKIFTAKTQMFKTLRTTMVIGTSSFALLFLSATIYNLGITISICGGSYLLGGSIYTYSLTKKKT